MIRLAAMTSVFPDWTLDEALPVLKRYRYDGIEPRVEWQHNSGIEASLTAAQRAEVRRKIEDAGLKVCAIATSVQAAKADAAERAKQMSDLKGYIDLAADLGAPCIRTFGGQRPRDRELKYIVDYVADAYMTVLDYAAARGVTVLMETHDDWCHSSEVRAVVEKANHPNLRVLWDIMHPQRVMELPSETYAVIGNLTRHLHAHDGIYPEGKSNVEVVPLGQGAFDHATPLHLLRRSGFDGYFSVEVIHAKGSQHDADGVLRQYSEGFYSIMDM